RCLPSRPSFPAFFPAIQQSILSVILPPLLSRCLCLPTPPQLLTRSAPLNSLQLATPPPANWTKLRGYLRPLDQVVGSEGSEAASPGISPSSAEAGWPGLLCKTRNFRDRKSSAASSAGWFAKSC